MRRRGKTPRTLADLLEQIANQYCREKYSATGGGRARKTRCIGSSDQRASSWAKSPTLPDHLIHRGYGFFFLANFFFHRTKRAFFFVSGLWRTNYFFSLFTVYRYGELWSANYFFFLPVWTNYFGSKQFFSKKKTYPPVLNGLPLITDLVCWERSSSRNCLYRMGHLAVGNHQKWPTWQQSIAGLQHGHMTD